MTLETPIQPDRSSSRPVATWLGIGMGATAALWTVLIVAMLHVEAGGDFMIPIGIAVAGVATLALIHRALAEKKLRAIHALDQRHEEFAARTSAELAEIRTALDTYAAGTKELLDEVSQKISGVYWDGYTTGAREASGGGGGGGRVVPFDRIGG